MVTRSTPPCCSMMKSFMRRVIAHRIGAEISPPWPRAAGRHRAVPRHNDFSNRPERKARELQVRPGKRDPDDRDGKEDRGQEMTKRQPPAGEHEPDYVADDSQRSSPD